jgi:hypothetical protein
MLSKVVEFNPAVWYLIAYPFLAKFKPPSVLAENC